MSESVLIANHHSASIIIARTIKDENNLIGRVPISPIVLKARAITHIDAEEWMEEIRTNAMVKKYIDDGLLEDATGIDKYRLGVEVRKTVELIPPKMLLHKHENDSEFASSLSVRY